MEGGGYLGLAAFQPSSRCIERPCLKEIRQRVKRQDTLHPRAFSCLCMGVHIYLQSNQVKMALIYSFQNSDLRFNNVKVPEWLGYSKVSTSSKCIISYVVPLCNCIKDV